MYFSPIFESIMAKIKSMSESEWETPAGRRLFALAMKHAPQELQDMFINGAMEQGIIPKATHCDTEGNPLYSIEELATHYGQTPEQVNESVDEVLEVMPELKEDLYQGTIHRFH